MTDPISVLTCSLKQDKYAGSCCKDSTSSSSVSRLSKESSAAFSQPAGPASLDDTQSRWESDLGLILFQVSKFEDLQTFSDFATEQPRKGCISSSQLVLFLKCLDRLAKGPVNYLLLLIGLVHLSGGLGPLSFIDKWSIKGCVGSKLFD